MSAATVLAPNATEEKAENARLASFVGAIAVGDLVKSTLGPKGMDKIIQTRGGKGMIVTNDGATILKSIHLDNAAAKVLVNLAKVQDEEVGDGTTSVCVLAAELLREAEQLIDRLHMHPQSIIEAYREAERVAREALEASAQDRSADKEALRQDLLAIAKTTLSSKVLAQDKEHFAGMAVEAVLRLGDNLDIEHIHLIKKIGGRLEESFLDDGFLLDKRIGVNQPKRIENPRILLANTHMDTDKVKVQGSRIRVEGTEQLAELERAERDKMKEKVERIKKHGINVFINRQLIYNWPEQLFADAGIMAIEHADFEGIERLGFVLGGRIASTFDHPEEAVLGKCKLVEEVLVGDEPMIRFSGIEKGGQACTIVLRGSSMQLLEEAERAMHDAFCVLQQTLKEPKTVLGGGASEMLMARAVDSLAQRVSGKKALAVEAFARALRALPTAIADNGGFDGAELVAQLRALYATNSTSTMGLDMQQGKTACMDALGVREALKLKRQVLLSASEASEMILRVDNILRAAPRQRHRE